MNWAGAALLAALSAAPAAAQTVGPCYSGVDAIANLAEPWEKNTRVFAKGAVRLAVIDTTEPAAAAFYLVIISPPYDELGLRQCRMIGGSEGLGLAFLTLEGMTADYDPSAGLQFSLPSGIYRADGSGNDPAVLTVTLNQATGAITAALD